MVNLCTNGSGVAVRQLTRIRNTGVQHDDEALNPGVLGTDDV